MALARCMLDTGKISDQRTSRCISGRRKPFSHFQARLLMSSRPLGHLWSRGHRIHAENEEMPSKKKWGSLSQILATQWIISVGYSNKVPQTWRFKATEMYTLSHSPEIRRPKSRSHWIGSFSSLWRKTVSKCLSWFCNWPSSPWVFTRSFTLHICVQIFS